MNLLNFHSVSLSHRIKRVLKRGGKKVQLVSFALVIKSWAQKLIFLSYDCIQGRKKFQI